jgi:endogenous inhibitor of DNA gyrase (YacG/DUF329 family)
MSRLPRGTCPVCKAGVALRKGALLREHPDHRHSLYGTGRGDEVPKCPASGKPVDWTGAAKAREEAVR